VTDALLDQFLAKRPAVRLQYEHEGSFREYGRRLFHRIPLGQGTRLTRLIVEFARAQVNFDIDERLLRAQLNQYPLVSSADHAGVLCQDILYNSNLLFSGLLDLQSLPYQIVLASTRIPLSNASHPRGITFQNRKHHFFPSKVMETPLCLFEDGIRVEQCRSLDTLFRPESLKELTSEQKKFLEFVFFEAINVAQVARTYSIFSDQLPAINNALWRRYFSRQYRMSRPALLSFPMDYFVRELLLEDLADRESLPYRILFHADVRSIYLEEFQGIAGCWGENSGTQFFWGVDERREFVALRVDPERNCLKSPTGSRPWEPVPLTPEAVAEALRQKRIVPSLFFEMLLVGFLEGYTLLGGFNQVTYMAWMRVAHERAMLRLGDWPMAARFARTLTDGLVCGPLPFPQWSSGFDLLWHFNSTDGKFNGDLNGGLDRQALEAMMDARLKTLLQNGVASMLQVID
jgi:hypothetical protein